MNLVIISGATGMTGNELSRQLLKDGNVKIIGFDNFFASSIKTVQDLLPDHNFSFHEWDLNHEGQMSELKDEILSLKGKYEKLIYINCAAVVHTEHFYHVERTFETNVVGMKKFLAQAI